MRIRKDKKMAQLGLSSDAVHFCQLNQSPWDVPSSSAHLRTSSSFQAVEQDVDEEELYLLGDNYLGAFDSSVASMESMRDGEDEIGLGNNREGKSNGQCKKAAKAAKQKQKKVVSTTGCGRGRGRPPKIKEDNPYTFYYYTGFGPSWGRKRSDSQSPAPAPARHAPIVYDDDDTTTTSSNNSESGSGSDSARKRMRRPVKERSLKSLM